MVKSSKHLKWKHYPAFRGDKIELLDAVVVGTNDNCEVLSHIHLKLLKVNLLLLLLHLIWLESKENNTSTGETSGMLMAIKVPLKVGCTLN